MKLGRYDHYNPDTGTFTSIIKASYQAKDVLDIDYTDIVTGATDAIAIRNWGDFGEQTTITTTQLRDEIALRAATYVMQADPLADIIVSEWFVVDKADRDLVHSDPDQIENAETLCKKLAVQGDDAFVLNRATKFKDSDKTAIDTDISSTIASAAFDLNYVHNQSTPSASWNINHNLAKFPSLVVVDSSGNEVEGEVAHTNNNSLTITFSAAFSGKAYLN